MLCNESSPILIDRVLVSDFPSSTIVIVTLIIAIIVLIFIHITLAVEACIQRTSKQLLEQTVMREEAPDYYLGEDTKYYTYVPAEEDPPPPAAAPAPAPPAKTAEPLPPTQIDNKALDDLLESSKKLKEKESEKK